MIMQSNTHKTTSNVMVAHMDTMKTFLMMQRDIMLAALGEEQAQLHTPSPQTFPVADKTSAVSYPEPQVVAYSDGFHTEAVPNSYSKRNGTAENLTNRNGHGHHPPIVQTVQLVPAPSKPVTKEHPAPATQGLVDQPAIMDALVNIVAESTGYPSEMIEPDLDLEADLGIDSIKRIEIVSVFQEQYPNLLTDEGMDDLIECKTLAEIVDFVAEQQAVGARVNFKRGGTDAPQHNYPFIRTITRFRANDLCEAQTILSYQGNRLLSNHTLGRHIACLDQTQHGLPIMPMTGTLEMLAEVTALVAVDQYIVGIKGATARGWLTVAGERAVRLLAQRVNATEIAAQLFVQEGANTKTIAEATFIVAEQYPQPASDLLPRAATPQPVEWASGSLYAQTGMFHGRGLQGVRSIDHLDADGLEATVVVLGRDELVTHATDTEMVLDPLFLDQLAQLSGFWGLKTFTPQTMVLPFHIEQLSLYRPMPAVAANEETRCIAQIRQSPNARTSADIDVWLPDGSLWLTVRGWQGRHFAMPQQLYEFCFMRRKTTRLSACTEDGQQTIDPADFPTAFFSSGGGIWCDVLAYVVLTAVERQSWWQLNLPPPHKLVWLLRRIVAKELLCRHLFVQEQLELAPADVLLTGDGVEFRPKILDEQARTLPTIIVSQQ
ncbi:MAG TPA: hypothetical protein ENJ56_03090, partial [Anaerolineae bacterium]|nr:hypothetical protein [Anaerolineae bacterium]